MGLLIHPPSAHSVELARAMLDASLSPPLPLAVYLPLALAIFFDIPLPITIAFIVAAVGYSNSADLMDVDRLELLIKNLVR